MGNFISSFYRNSLVLFNSAIIYNLSSSDILRVPGGYFFCSFKISFSLAISSFSFWNFYKYFGIFPKPFLWPSISVISALFYGAIGGKFIGYFALVPEAENLFGRFDVFFSSYYLFALDLDIFLGLFSYKSFLNSIFSFLSIFDYSSFFYF